MTAFKSIMEITSEEWLSALRLSQEDVPDAVIVEGSWWRQQRTDWRLSYLEDVRELAFPDMFWGRWKNKKVAFCCAYGAPRTVEVIYLFCKLGAKLAVQIGTCGGLQTHLQTGDIILPKVAIGRDGVAHLMGAVEGSMADEVHLEKAKKHLEARQHRTHTGPHLTWSALFAQDGHMVEIWHHAGYLSVDMETATTYATAAYHRASAVSMLVVWDDLTRGRSFLDPLPEESQAELDRANESVYEVALELIETI